jgi:anaerobic ribonucleoside-triphosphate reductase activating protein
MLLHAFIPASRANGPGLRSVVFFQGCTLACRNCFSPHSHSFSGADVTILAVAEQLLQAHQEHRIEGVTFSGGEPMQQAPALLELMQILRQRVPNLSFGMFSGYGELELALGRYWTWGRDDSEPERRLLWEKIRGHLDFAVLGRFNEAQPCGMPLCTSRSKALRMLSSRYSAKDYGPQSVEVIIHSDGRAEVTGFPILGLPWQRPPQCPSIAFPCNSKRSTSHDSIYGKVYVRVPCCALCIDSACRSSHGRSSKHYAFHNRES